MLTPMDKKYVRQIVDDDKDASRIIGHAFELRRKSDEQCVVKNGIKRLFYVRKQTPDGLAAVLAGRIKSGSVGSIYVYLRKPRTNFEDVIYKVKAACDLGIIPLDIGNIELIKPKDVKKCLEYTNRVGGNIVWIADETGEHDFECIITQKMFKRFKVPGYLTWDYKYAWRVDDNEVANAIVYDSERASLSRPRYERAAREFELEHLEELSNNLRGHFFGFVDFLSRRDEYVEVAFCGHMGKQQIMVMPDLRGESYREQGFSCEEVNVNMSCNMPYQFPDRRAYAFDECEQYLRRARIYERKFAELRDIVRIWETYILKDQTGEMHEAWRKIEKSHCKTNPQRLERFADKYGIKAAVDMYYEGEDLELLLELGMFWSRETKQAALDAYRDGIPFDDIIA